MPPKSQKTATERPYNLGDAEVNVALHACKLLVYEGKVDKFSLAEASGYDKPETVKRMWSKIRNKMGSVDASPAGPAGSSSSNALETPTKQAIKRKGGDGATNKSGKRVKFENVKEEDDDEEDYDEDDE